MNTEHITPNFTVSSQITEEDVETIAHNGVKLLICNRPDQEEPNQPAFADIQSKAESLGIKTAYIPFTANSLSQAHVDEFLKVYDENVPTFAYCRSGNRCKVLLQASQQQ